MMSSPFAASFAGGLMIGLSAALLMMFNGRVAGISGIVAALMRGSRERLAMSAAFLAGLIAGPFLYAGMTGAWPAMTLVASWPVVLAAGLLVGFGTRMGSGCTSGHGVVGLARLSPRSFAAVATFLLAAIATVFVMRLFGGLS